MKEEKTKFTLRIEAETLHKFHYAAKRNLRPVNKKLEEIDHNNHQRYWISVFSKQVVALPPLAEQQRIVERIDYLYSLLDNIR